MTGAFAQNVYSPIYQDFGLWTGVSASHELNDLYKVGLSTQLRLENNVRQFQSFLIEATIERDLPDKWELAADLRFTRSIDENSLRVSPKVYKSIEFNQLEFRYRAQTDLEIAHNFDQNMNSYSGRLRNRIESIYDIKSIDTKVGLSIEWNHNFEPMLHLVNRIRWKAEIQYDVNDHVEIELGFFIQQEYNERTPLREFIVPVKFKYTL